MPEVQRSFYTTGKVGIDYFHYVADELPAICGKWFHLDQRRENTFIAGESMGGYGAVKIALNRPEKYEAVASLSGVLDYVGFTEMVLAGKLNEHLYQIDEECNQMMDRLVEQMKGAHGVTEELKMQDQMVWVGRMNNIRACAEEIVLEKIVYE